MRTARILVLSLLAIGFPLLTGTGALASSSILSDKPDPGTPSFDGRVDAIVRSGNVVYVGGEFTHMVTGGSTVDADHVAAFDATTLEPTSWSPAVDGPVYALAVSTDGSTVYIGGLFNSVDTEQRTNFAAVGSDGTPLPWSSNTNASVRAILVRGSKVYLGGAFRKVQGGTPRLGLAAINGSTGGLIAKWNPGVTNEGSTAIPIVRGLADSTHGDIVAVGKFTNANGTGGTPQNEADQARFSATTGVLRPWALDFPYTTYAIVGDGEGFYLAGGGPGGTIFHVTRTGKKVWSTTTDGDVQAVTLFQGEVVAGGHFTQTHGDANLPRLVALSAADGTPDASWQPNPNNVDSSVWVLTGTATTLYVGGGFTAVGGDNAFSKFAQFGQPTAPTAL